MIRASVLCLCALALACNLATAQSVPPGVSLFPDCDKPELLAHGRPVMMFVKPQLGMGISIAKETFEAGTPDTLNVWVDNQSGEPVSVDTCSFVGLFLVRGIDILDGGGHRVLSKVEEKACAGEHYASIFVCRRDIPVEVPAHTCLTRDDDDFSINLTDRYSLPPGEYTLRLRPTWMREERNVCKPENAVQFQRQLGDLTFTVTP